MTSNGGSDVEVRAQVYRLYLELARAPVAAEVADALSMTQAAVEDAFARLAADHLLVLAPGTPYIWMANPFSALPTAYAVETDGRQWFGNCIWDALDILALVGDGGVSQRAALTAASTSRSRWPTASLWRRRASCITRSPRLPGGTTSASTE